MLAALRILPFLVIAYAIVTIAILWCYQRTRLFPLYVLKVLWVCGTILAFAWVIAMSGGQSKEYIQNPAGPLEVLIGKMEKDAGGQNVLRGGYPESLRNWYHISPVGALAILAGTWVSWGVLSGRQEQRRVEAGSRPAGNPRWSRRCLVLMVALLALLWWGMGWRDAAAFAAVLAAWFVLAGATPQWFDRWGGWAVVGLLAVVLLPMIPPAGQFDWGRYRYFGENYRHAWVEGHIGQYFINSLIVTVTTVSVTTLTGAMAAYTIARQRFAGQALLYGLVIGGITVPAILIQVPLFLLVKDWGFAVGSGRFAFMDSRLGLATIYAGISLPFTIFVLTGFFRTLPTELGEAACIDGSTRWGTFSHVYLPLALPGLATTGIFNFLGAWNEFNLGMIFMSNPNFKTLPIGLYELQIATQYSSAWAPLFAGIVLLCLPTFLIFVFLQERIVAGLTAGASKG